MPRGSGSIGRPKSSKNKDDFKAGESRRGSDRLKRKLETPESNLMKHFGIGNNNNIEKKVKLQ